MLGLTEIFDGTLNPVTGVPITGTAFSTNTLDLLCPRDLGVGQLLGIHVDILTSLVGGTSLQVAVHQSADNVTFFETQLSPPVPVANLVAGMRLFPNHLEPNQPLNVTGANLNPPGRFIKLQYIVVGAFTGGSIFSYLNPALDRNLFWAYPNNYTVLVPAAEV